MRLRVLLLVLVTSSAAAQELPPCATLQPVCPDPEANSCFLLCVDDKGCKHRRMVYVQDCRIQNGQRPNFCPPGFDKDRNPMLTGFDRKLCVEPPPQ